jgi:hypothetical protein
MNSTLRRTTLIGITALLVGLATGGIAQANPSRAEFIRRGDALCTQTKKALAPIRARAQAAKTLPTDAKWQAAADIWADQIAIQRRFIAKFRAIGTPAGDQSANSLVSSMSRGLVLAVNVQRGFADRHSARLPGALSSYVTFTLNLNRRVAAYGFRVCGR